MENESIREQFRQAMEEHGKNPNMPIIANDSPEFIAMEIVAKSIQNAMSYAEILDGMVGVIQVDAALGGPVHERLTALVEKCTNDLFGLSHGIVDMVDIILKASDKGE